MDCTRAGFALWAMEASMHVVESEAFGVAMADRPYTQIEIDGFMARAMGGRRQR